MDFKTAFELSNFDSVPHYPLTWRNTGTISKNEVPGSVVDPYMFLDLPDPDRSGYFQSSSKNSKKNLDFYSFVTSL
jgi:hypothetical protein